MDLQEETGFSTKWVTRFQRPEFLLIHRDTNGAYFNSVSCVTYLLYLFHEL